MAIRTVDSHHTGDGVDDLHAWLRTLPGCPPVTATAQQVCPAHDEPATWFVVTADARAGVASWRCLACGATTDLLDSRERWTYPRTWACGVCLQSIAEVALGLSVPPGAAAATWLAVAVRCVGCGLIAGVTDLAVPAGAVVAGAPTG